jgi:hypothetical protein
MVSNATIRTIRVAGGINAILRAVFDRSSNTISCEGIAVSRDGEADVLFPLCRRLVAAGYPDQPLAMDDDRGVRCLTVSSITAGARSAYEYRHGRLTITRHLPGPHGARSTGGKAMSDMEV